MHKEELVEMDGTVTEVLPDAIYRVELENGNLVSAYAGSRIRRFRIRVVTGDKVKLEFSPDDLTRGRISLRYKD